MDGDNLLIVTDSATTREMLAAQLRSPHWRTLYAGGAAEAASIARAIPLALIVGAGLSEDGWSTLAHRVRDRAARTLLLRVFAPDEGGTGAIALPLDGSRVTTPDHVRHTVEQMLNGRRGQMTVERRTGDPRPRSRRFIGVSQAVRDLLLAVQAVPAETNVLVLGESGTGKELVARMVADQARGLPAPFVSLGCGALSQRAGARALFGVPGAVPANGALARAAGGTLMLDEIGDLPSVLQEALAPLVPRVPVRFIATSSRSLDGLRGGVVRRDLLAMIARSVIVLPPLRDRMDDLAPLAEFFAARQAAEGLRAAPILSPGALEKLQAHDWPGNVRELQHAIARAVVHCDGEVIEARHIQLDSLSLPAVRAAEDRRARATSAVGA